MKNDVAKISTDLSNMADSIKTVDTKLETAIEARLIDTVEQKISSKVKDTAKALQEDVAEKMEIERRLT